MQANFADIRKSSVSLWEHNARKRALGRPADEFKEERFRSKLRRIEMVEEQSWLTKQARRDQGTRSARSEMKPIASSRRSRERARLRQSRHRSGQRGVTSAAPYGVRPPQG